MSKRIPLTQGKFAIVDNEDYLWLNQWKWHYSHGGYARRRKREASGKWQGVFMHRLILRPPNGMESDHINGDGLDNQRHNLRICARTQNTWNVKKRIGCTSKYKGVGWYPNRQKWHARITVNGKRYHLGYFELESDAAAAYNAAARTYHEAFARLNMIGEGT